MADDQRWLDRPGGRHVHSVPIPRIGGLAILLGLVPKLAAVLQTVPQAVLGGLSIVLFGMIFLGIGGGLTLQQRIFEYQGEQAQGVVGKIGQRFIVQPAGSL